MGMFDLPSMQLPQLPKMPRTIGELAGNVANASNTFGNQIQNAAGNGTVGSIVKGAWDTGPGLMPGTIGMVANAVTPKAPPAMPGIDKNSPASQLQQQQADNAKSFRDKLPEMQRQNNEMLSQQANRQMDANIETVKQRNTHRGLSYGGINQGQQQGMRSQEQQSLAGAISGSNAGLLSAADTLDQQALSSGTQLQANAQAVQNQIYQQQLTQMQSNNSIIGSALGTGLLAAILAV